MAENSENIEARLCAYVEGELDEQGKLEIEKHLEAHPNHRRLINELIATRDLLRFLPREQAPIDLSETFNAQLERSALLDGPGPELASQSLPGNFLPRLFAAAAIVVLASGLFAIVYMSLPRANNGLEPLAVKFAPPDSRPTETETALADASRSDREITSLKPERAERMSKGGFADDRKSKASIHDVYAGAGAAEPVYVLVSADKVDQAVREVTTTLVDNSIRWEPATDLTPLPSRLQNYAANTNKAYESKVSNSSQVAQLELSNALQKRSQHLYQQQAAAGKAYARPAEPATLPAKPATSDGPALAHSAGERDPHVARSPIPQAGVVQSDTQGEKQAETQPRQQPAASVGDVVAINAYGVSRRQVEQLGLLLNRGSQRVELISDDSRLQEANSKLQRMLVQELPEPLAPTTNTVFAENGRAEENHEQPAKDEAGTARKELAAAEASPVAPSSLEPFRAKSDSAPAAETRVGKSGPTTMLMLPQASPALADAGAQPREQAKGEFASRVGGGSREGPMRAGEKFYVTVDELKSPDTDATTQVRVETDGSLKLPKLKDHIHVEGMTRTQAQRAIAEAYQAAGVVDKPTVTVEPVQGELPSSSVGSQVAQQQLAPGPADQGLLNQDKKQSLQVRPTTQPVQQPLSQVQADAVEGQRQRNLGGSPTTRPTGEDADLDDLVDVVFLVQSNASTPIDAAQTPSAMNEKRNENDAPNAATSEPAVAPPAVQSPSDAAKSEK